MSYECGKLTMSLAGASSVWAGDVGGGLACGVEDEGVGVCEERARLLAVRRALVAARRAST